MSRRWTQSLGARLFVAFALVATLGVGTVALVSRQVMARQFTIYVSNGRQMRAEQWAGLLSDTLQAMSPSERAQAWADLGGLVQTLSETPERGLGRGQGRGGRGQQAGGEDRILILESNAEVVYDSGNQLAGQVMDAALLERAAPIVVDDQVFGRLLIVQADLSAHSAQETQFLDTINRAVLWAAVLAAAASLAAVALLSRQLAAPLRRLTAAAEAMAAGDLGQRVPVHSKDEIGELGRAFNSMAADLEQADTQRRQMTADIAHELRNPLAIVRGNLEAMLDGLYPADSEHLSLVYEETLILQRLVEDLRLLSLAEAGQLTLNHSDVDVSLLLNAVANGARAVATDLGLSLYVDMPSEPLNVDGDTTRLHQVLGNLVSNALRYTPPKGKILLSARPIADQVQIVVSDSGSGIDPQDLPHIFDRFYRGSARGAVRDPSPGESGLGLAIAKALVEAHGGTIAATSTLGHGTSFTIDLPRS